MDDQYYSGQISETAVGTADPVTVLSLCQSPCSWSSGSGARRNLSMSGTPLSYSRKSSPGRSTRPGARTWSSTRSLRCRGRGSRAVQAVCPQRLSALLARWRSRDLGTPRCPRYGCADGRAQGGSKFLWESYLQPQGRNTA